MPARSISRWTRPTVWLQIAQPGASSTASASPATPPTVANAVTETKEAFAATAAVVSKAVQSAVKKAKTAVKKMTDTLDSFEKMVQVVESTAQMLGMSGTLVQTHTFDPAQPDGLPDYLRGVLDHSTLDADEAHAANAGARRGIGATL